MLQQEISDYRQLKAIRKKMETPEFGREKYFLKSVYNCGKKVPVISGKAAVALVANKKQAKFMGVASCKSSWGCPVCTARQMSKYAAKIAIALDALKERSLSAAMITFTIPHTRGFSCEQATEILYKSWKAFTVHGNKILKATPNDIFSKFMAEFGSKHRVRVTEYTFGNAGWHPHMHCLFWFPSNRIQEILDWEERLNERWLELTKRYTIRELLIGYPETQRKTVRAKVETRVNIMYSRMNTDESHGVYISKDENNKVIVQQSSDYICGWGGNREVTGNYQNKATKPGHYSWQQILANAIAADQKAGSVSSAAILSSPGVSSKERNADLSKKILPPNADNPISYNEGYKMKLNELKPAEGSRKNEESEGAAQAPDWWQLYFEYMNATKKARHARVNFSVHSGLNAIIAAYKQTNGYKSVLKKNLTDRRETFGVWKTVCWFSKSQWSEICENDLEPVILSLAHEENAKKLIDRVLADYQIEPSVENQEQAAKLEAILNVA